jgi:hypothetical protein
VNLDVAPPLRRRARIKAARGGFVKRGVLRRGFRRRKPLGGHGAGFDPGFARCTNESFKQMFTT